VCFKWHSVLELLYIYPKGNQERKKRAQKNIQQKKRSVMVCIVHARKNIDVIFYSMHEFHQWEICILENWMNFIMYECYERLSITYIQYKYKKMEVDNNSYLKLSLICIMMRDTQSSSDKSASSENYFWSWGLMVI